MHVVLSVKELNREYRAEWAAQKERAREEQKERRELVLDDRRAQTAALVTVARVNAEHRAAWQAEKKQAQEAPGTRVGGPARPNYGLNGVGYWRGLANAGE